MSTPATNVAVTDFGTVTYTEDACAIFAEEHQLHAWAHRPGMSWPCSALARLDTIAVTFDSNGLLDIAGDSEDLSVDELNAWGSDVLRDVLPESHPAHFVTVGQFS